MSMGYWEHFPHGADIGVRGVGTTKEEAFEQAALAMVAVVTDLAAVEARSMVSIECEAPDDELLLVDWLNGAIYEMSSHKMLFSRFAVRFDGSRLHGQAWGERLDPLRHDLAVEVKGATYTALRVGLEKGLWIAQTVLDV
jgi:SHS2 domain-containing protein